MLFYMLLEECSRSVIGPRLKEKRWRLMASLIHSSGSSKANLSYVPRDVCSSFRHVKADNDVSNPWQVQGQLCSYLSQSCLLMRLASCLADLDEPGKRSRQATLSEHSTNQLSIKCMCSTYLAVASHTCQTRAGTPLQPINQTITQRL